ncbi:DMT family transporter [Accumulibacter sp.]|uniref:DMT family transporter n=1 Tax=Accumulibacter sp. TaxID=2053492 RepID=UPI002608430E|nr:DMT family transporter [Accumulibacter sp.]
MISTPVALLVLLAALLHAGWNCLLKASSDRLLDTVGLAVAGSLLSACLLPFLPLPAPASLPWLGATIIVHVAYFLGLVETYRDNDLSLAYPLMRGIAPVLVALFMAALGEPLGSRGVLGVALIGIGITLPAWSGLRQPAFGSRRRWYAAGNGVIIAVYTVIDGIGVRLSESAASYTLWLFFLDGWGILAVGLWRRGGGVAAYLCRRRVPAVAGSLLSVGSYGIVLWAMTVASIPAVAALRESSVVFAALLGHYLLKEPMGPWRLLGALFVALGAVLLRCG